MKRPRNQREASEKSNAAVSSFDGEPTWDSPLFRVGRSFSPQL